MSLPSLQPRAPAAATVPSKDFVKIHYLWQTFSKGWTSQQNQKLQAREHRQSQCLWVPGTSWHTHTHMHIHKASSLLRPKILHPCRTSETFILSVLSCQQNGLWCFCTPACSLLDSFAPTLVCPASEPLFDESKQIFMT